MKKILALYELSGVFTKLYKEAGFDVIQKDIQLDGKDLRLMEYINDDIYGIISHPPCTHFAGSGARWWKNKGDKPLIDGLSMVDVVLRMVAIYKPKFWFIENPVGRLKDYLGKPTLYFHPYEYAGHLFEKWENPQDEAYTKKTCLWGEFNIPTKLPVKCERSGDYNDIHYPRDKNGKAYGWNTIECKNARSKTPIGFAKAFVEFNH